MDNFQLEQIYRSCEQIIAKGKQSTVSGGASSLTLNDTDTTAWSITATTEPASADVTKTKKINIIPAIITPLGGAVVAYKCGLHIVVTVGAFAGGCTTLNYRVKVNGVSQGTGTLPASTATTLAFNVGGTTPKIDNTNNTIELFFWVDAGNAAITSIVTSFGLGTANLTGDQLVLQVSCSSGMGRFYIQAGRRAGSGGGCIFKLDSNNTSAWPLGLAYISGSLTALSDLVIPIVVIEGGFRIYVTAGSAADLYGVDRLGISLQKNGGA